MAIRGGEVETGRDRPFDFQAQDLNALDQSLGQIGDCRLVVVDPITVLFWEKRIPTGTPASAHLLAPLAELAARRHVAVICIAHLWKADGKTIYPAMGSLAFAAAARSVWAVVKDREDKQRRLLLPVKEI